MKFMLLIHDKEGVATPPQVATMSEEHAAYQQALIKAGILLGGERLRPTSEGARVRVRDGKTELLDGPYAETKEQFGGYYMIEVPDMAAAQDWASQCPSAKTGTVEVRPLWLRN